MPSTVATPVPISGAGLLSGAGVTVLNCHWVIVVADTPTAGRLAIVTPRATTKARGEFILTFRVYVFGQNPPAGYQGSATFILRHIDTHITKSATAPRRARWVLTCSRYKGR